MWWSNKQVREGRRYALYSSRLHHNIHSIQSMPGDSTGIWESDRHRECRRCYALSCLIYLLVQIRCFDGNSYTIYRPSAASEGLPMGSKQKFCPIQLSSELVQKEIEERQEAHREILTNYLPPLWMVFYSCGILWTLRQV